MNLASLALTILVVSAQPSNTRAPATSPGHEDGHFGGEGGLSLFEQSWRPAAPRGTVVLIHGLKDHSSRYAPLAQQLVDDGFAVYAMDLRGHGRSPGERAWVDSFSQYEDDLDAFLQFVRAREPGRPIFLFGHSMGGAIVTLYAIQRQPELAGLVLSGPALEPGDNVSGLLIALAKFFGWIAPHAGLLELKDEDFSRDPAVVASMKSDPLVYDKSGPARTAAELLRTLVTIGQGMERVNLPLLDLHGSADKVTNPDGSRDLVARAASKDKTLKIYDGYFHDLLHEPGHERVAADIVAWVDARAPRPDAAPEKPIRQATPESIPAR